MIYFSWPRLWVSCLLGIVTWEELRDPSVIFNFECCQDHLCIKKARYVPVEISWFDQDLKLSIMLAGMQFRGIDHGYVPRVAVYVDPTHLPIWKMLKQIIMKANADGRVHWMQQIAPVDDLQIGLPEYQWTYDGAGNKLGAMVTWQVDGHWQRHDLSATHYLHYGWPALHQGRRDGESNALSIRPYGKPPAWRTI